MTLSEWRLNKELVLWARKLFSDPNWGLLMKVMQSEHPKEYQDVSGTMTADRELGIIYGYDRYQNNLNRSIEDMDGSTLPEPTFEPEPNQEKQNATKASKPKRSGYPTKIRRIQGDGEEIG